MLAWLYWDLQSSDPITFSQSLISFVCPHVLLIELKFHDPSLSSLSYIWPQQICPFLLHCRCLAKPHLLLNPTLCSLLESELDAECDWGRRKGCWCVTQVESMLLNKHLFSRQLFQTLFSLLIPLRLSFPSLSMDKLDSFFKEKS